MTLEEMINFNISECVTILNHRINTEIINGIYTISQKNEIDFNEEQIKELLLMFKPMQKELATYKKALRMACNELGNVETNCRFCPADCTRYDNPSECGVKLREYFLQKAGEAND